MVCGSLSYHLQLCRGPSTSLASSRSFYWRGLLEQSYCSSHHECVSSRDSSMCVAEGPHQEPGGSMIEGCWNQIYSIGERRRQGGRFAMSSITTAQKTCKKILPFYWLSTLTSLLLSPCWEKITWAVLWQNSVLAQQSSLSERVSGLICWQVGMSFMSPIYTAGKTQAASAESLTGMKFKAVVGLRALFHITPEPVGREQWKNCIFHAWVSLIHSLSSNPADTALMPLSSPSIYLESQEGGGKSRFQPGKKKPIACFLVHSKNGIFRKKIWIPKYSSQKIKFLIFGNSGQVWAAQFLTVKQHIFAPFFSSSFTVCWHFQMHFLLKCSFSWTFSTTLFHGI